MNLEILQER